MVWGKEWISLQNALSCNHGIPVMIRNFADARLEHFWKWGTDRRVPAELHGVLKRKLIQLHAAEDLNVLRQSPANRLEALKGTRKGFYSIRVNSQWRLVFAWDNNAASRVALVDYHR